MSFVALQKKKKGFHLVFALSSPSNKKKKKTSLDKNTLRSFVLDQWLMDVINLQMCYITKQSLAATKTNGKTMAE